MAKKNEIAKRKPRNFPAIQELPDFMPESRFVSIQEAILDNLAENLSLSLGADFQAGAIGIEPALFGYARMNFEKPALFVKCMFTKMNFPFLLYLPQKISEKLLVIAMGGFKQRKSNSYIKETFRPAGVATLVEIAGLFTESIKEAWSLFSDGENAEIVEEWTNPAICNAFPDSETMVEVKFSLLEDRDIRSVIADDSDYVFSLFMPWSGLVPIASLLTVSGVPRISFNPGPQKELPLQASNLGFWTRLLAWFGIKKEGKPIEHYIFQDLDKASATAGAAVLAREHPQLAAAALACITRRKAADIINAMEQYEMRRDLIERMKVMDIRQGNMLLPAEDVIAKNLARLQTLDVAVKNEWN